MRHVCYLIFILADTGFTIFPYTTLFRSSVGPALSALSLSHRFCVAFRAAEPRGARSRSGLSDVIAMRPFVLPGHQARPSPARGAGPGEQGGTHIVVVLEPGSQRGADGGQTAHEPGELEEVHR